MVLELHFIGGAAIFALGHVVAVALYLRNRRAGANVPAAALLFAASVAAAAILAPVGWRLPIAFYTIFLGAMVASASLSRFPQAFVGALLFLGSDLLIFARMGLLQGESWVSPTVWLSYFGGQALIAWGVASRLDISSNRH